MEKTVIRDYRRNKEKAKRDKYKRDYKISTVNVTVYIYYHEKFGLNKYLL